MAASLIARSVLTDDDGTGTTGTIWTNAELAKIYDAIDLAHSGTGAYAAFNFGGGLRIDGVLDVAGVKETITPLGSLAFGTVTFNCGLGSIWTLKLTAAAGTTTITNIAVSGRLQAITFRVEGDGTTRAWTWFDSTVQWGGDVAPVRTITNGKFDWYTVLTVNGGTTWAGFILGQNMDA